MPVFEMLWNCQYCGTRKLLGKTHRFCPGCGAPQDPSRRYFPADDEKVAVEGHVYVGADRLCASCNSAMSANAKHCTQCGASMVGAQEARRVSGAPVGPPPIEPAARLMDGAQEARRVSGPPVGPPPMEPAARLADAVAVRRSRWNVATLLGGFGAVLGVILLAILVAVFWRREAGVRVIENSWKRSIDIERLGPRSESSWCDEMAGDAYDVSRAREVRSHRQVQDGEDCATARIDQGDGTYREEERCAPRYRSEPVYDDRCRYTVDRWSLERKLELSGDSLNPAPAWPRVELRAGDCRGCERQGARRETYAVIFEETGRGKRLNCDMDESRWKSFASGSRWRLKIGVLTGFAACDTLKSVER